MKLKQLMALALIGFAVGACKRPDGGDSDVVEPEGELVKTSLAIQLPKTIRTYALGDGDAYATADEVDIDLIDVFVYEDGGSYAVDHFSFTSDETMGTPPATVDPTTLTDVGFALDASDHIITADFSVREGDKLVYVGLNLPDLIRDRLSTGYYVNEIFENPDLIGQLITLGTAGGANGSAQVPYFSSGRGINVTFSAADDAQFSVSVNRLVAKIIVMATDGTESGYDTRYEDVSGGTVTNFEFTIGQRNNQMFAAPLDGLLGATPGAPGEDPNHGIITGVGAATPASAASGSPISMFQVLSNPGTAGYKEVNPIITDFTDNNHFVHYTTENTSANHQHQDVTYVSVRAQFVPHKLGGDPTNGDAGEDNPDDEPPVTPGHILYAVFTGDASGDGSNALGARYFYDIEEAREFVMGDYFEQQVLLGSTVTSSNGGTPGAAYVPSAAPGESDFYIFAYQDSWCYYRIYLNPDGVAENDGGGITTGTTNAYDVLRNTVYVARISGVNYIGTTNPVAIPGGLEDGTQSEADVTGGLGLANFRGTPIYPGEWFPNLFSPTPIYPEHQITEATFAAGLSVDMTVEDWYEHDDDYELN